MTRKEWMEKNLPAYIDDCSDGGVISCPRSYNELVRIDPSVLTHEPCEGCREVTPFVCEKCWNMELNIEALLLEAGDVLWYLTELCNELGISVDTIAKLNLQKLKNRYPDGFTHEASRERKE